MNQLLWCNKKPSSHSWWKYRPFDKQRRTSHCKCKKQLRSGNFEMGSVSNQLRTSKLLKFSKLEVDYNLWNDWTFLSLTQKVPFYMFLICDQSQGRLKYTNNVSDIFLSQHVYFFLMGKTIVISSFCLCLQRLSLLRTSNATLKFYYLLSNNQ